jgi:hypothetical protein
MYNASVFTSEKNIIFISKNASWSYIGLAPVMPILR